VKSSLLMNVDRAETMTLSEKAKVKVRA